SIQPLLTRLQSLGAAGKPFAGNLAELLTSLRSTGGLERLMDFIFLSTGITNGYDALGHFLRAEIVGAPGCLTYAVITSPACGNEKLFNLGTPPTEKATAARVGANTSLVMARTLAVLKGATPAQALARYPGSAPSAAEVIGAGAPAAGGTVARPVGGASAGTTYYTPSQEAGTSGMLLNYLLGN
ncbi:MAG TPA: hypothetical protein VNZ05_07540, partial [Solirubrobacteraceae bacterium]|nr:hypothetical protein [Solirubrobacteraceae bacterium]